MARRYRRHRRKHKRSFASSAARWASTASKTAYTAHTALRLARGIARMVNVEYKFAPVNISSTPNQAGTIINITNAISSGDSATTRTGDGIKLIRLSGRMHMEMATNMSFSTVRCVLFRGKHENGAATPYAVTDILDNFNYATAANLYLSPKTWQERFNTSIIYDKTYNMSLGGKASYDLDWNFRLRGHTNYVQVGDDVENGGLYLLLISSRNSPNLPVVSGALRLTFTDN